MAKLSEQRIFQGLSSEAKPIGSDAHNALALEDLYRELDTGQEYIWTGTQWEFRASSLAPLLLRLLNVQEEMLHELKLLRLGHEMVLLDTEISSS